MADVALAFFWHQHQPYYPDDVTGENPMPWVRLHGVKDYYGMALHLLEYPEMRATINLVPSLLVQLLAYTEDGATDQFLEISRKPADSLTEAECRFLLDNFFMANPDHMIRPFPRYAELHHRRAAGRNSAAEALRRFQERDLRDLQVWFNLTWVHPLAVEQDAGLRELHVKGRHFSEEEKNWLLDKHLELLREILPLHRRLAETGQVELTTTPFYHPILPLLLDKKLAREAMPDVKLPHHAAGYPDDAEVQMRRAVEFHTRLFGQPPRGMWPAEGSVCQSMLPLLARHGIRWIASDEEVLNESLLGAIGRDARGHVRSPERLYRPYKVSEGGCELGIVFRDHALSDQIGFHYQRSEPVAAAEDFIGRARAIGQTLPADQPALLSIILDGENCWEHFPDGGVPFLRALYERCVKAGDLQPVQIGEYLHKYPPREMLPHLFAGSWIQHNFAIWIGHEEDNAAWDALHRTREYLKDRETRRLGDKETGRQGDWETGLQAVSLSPCLPVSLSPEERAWVELYIAEGSDWFWWYGDDHSSAQDEQFDFLFRKHLRNVYLLLGDEPPPDLARPIKQRGRRAIHTHPRAFLDVRLDGKVHFFEWLTAGRYNCRNERGTMALTSAGPLRDIYFGFSRHALLIRIDFDRPARAVLPDFESVRLVFIEPMGVELCLRLEPSARLAPQLRCTHQATPTLAESPDLGIGIDQVLEVAIPFERLGVTADAPIQFYVELLQGPHSRDRAPLEGVISLSCPSADFERIMWDV